MFNTILSVAALGVVAFILVFVHPVSQAHHVAAATADVTHASPHLAVSQ